MCTCSVTWLCPTLCDPMDCSPLSSSVHRIVQARILEQVVISCSRASSHPWDQTRVSDKSPTLAGNFFTTEPPGKPFTNSEVLQTLSFNHWPLGCSISSLSPLLSCPGVGLKVPLGQQRIRWLEGITDWNDMRWSKLWELLTDREAWHAVPTQLSYLTDWLNYKVSNTYTLQNVSVGVTSLA